MGTGEEIGQSAGSMSALAAHPSRPLYAAVGAVLLSIVLLAIGAFASSSLAISIAGYVIASLVAFTLVALSRRAWDEHAMATGRTMPRRLRQAAASTLVVGLLAAAGNAYLIATVFA